MEKKIAILIDGDNAESGLVEQYIMEVERFGRATVKRVYADWMDIRMKNWKEQLNKFAVRPIQKFAYTTGKNSTDTALIIDAMDLLHSKKIDGICIVSSDSDYTGLAHRIREDGLFVMGIGRAHTPQAFVAACETFILSEVLQIIKSVKEKDELVKSKIKEYEKTKVYEETIIPAPKLITPEKSNNIISLPNKLIVQFIDEQIETAFQKVVDIHTKQALLSKFCAELRKTYIGFDHKNFGHGSFKAFCEALPGYQIIVGKDKQMFLAKKKGNF